jgi:predicted dehydrogenase/GNAT superfamily N-acetyltransferase
MTAIRLAIIGACGRGAAFKRALDAIPDLKVTAVCDLDSAGLKQAAADLGAAHAFTDYQELLEHAPVDAVLLGTPMPLHVPQSIAALQRNIHVLCEVPAGVSLEECQQLVLAARRSSAIYMMAENYIYSRQNRLITELVRRGLFGTPYFADGEYLHELKELNEKTPWRRRWQTGINGITYGTHSLGPILQWMPNDRVVAVSCAGSGHHYKDPRGNEYENEDAVVMLCKMASGGLVKIRVDMLSDRPHAMTNYQLQGTDGCYESARALGEPDRIWLRARNPSPDRWENLADLENEFLPADIRHAHDAANAMGHGGGDYFELLDFVQAIRGERPPTVGIDQAMDMTLPGLLSQRSIAEGGKWIAVPDSREWKPDYRFPKPSLHMRLPDHRLEKLPLDLPAEYRLRQYEARDADDYIALMHAGDLGAWDAARVQSTFEATLHEGLFIVEHLPTQKAVATAMALHRPTDLHPHGGELGWVACHPDHRGKRLGQLACAAVINLFLARGYREIYLLTDDFRLPAIQTYLRLGFEPMRFSEEMHSRWQAIENALQR